MKRIFFLSLFLLTSLQIVYSQDNRYIQQPAVGVHILLNAFSYKDSLHMPGKFNYLRAGIALNYLKGFTPRTDLNINLAGSFLAFPGIDKGEGNKQLLLEADASLREKLFAGRRRVNPFLQAGLGISRFIGYYGVFIPAGLGLQVNLPGEAFLLFHSQYRIPLTSTQSGHFYGSIGIAGIIGKKKSLKIKKGTVLPARSLPVGHPGKDTDGDGIVDSLDACPFVAGLQSYHGCPIPDRDKDGVNDEEDKCPDLPGDKGNAGCPLVQKDIREKIEWAAKNVFFETDRYKLLPASYKALDEVARILKENTLLKLDIGGHTDSTGSPEKNRTLSGRRAGSVLEYLSARAGIKKERLSAAGYGSARPVADNNTPEGRALNRRVEFKLKYY
jgi:OOP family OmpA-OmpF porin